MDGKERTTSEYHHQPFTTNQPKGKAETQKGQQNETTTHAPERRPQKQKKAKTKKTKRTQKQNTTQAQLPTA